MRTVTKPTRNYSLAMRLVDLPDMCFLDVLPGTLNGNMVDIHGPEGLSTASVEYLDTLDEIVKVGHVWRTVSAGTTTQAAER